METPTKNYVGELQEHCQTAHIGLPEYLDQTEGNIFKFTCRLQDSVCYGTGNSKKFAKQNAAKEMLKTIKDKNMSCTLTVKNQENVNTNSISKLNEFCSKGSKNAPLYAELPKQGDLFVFECTVEEFSATGQGRSKKEAKEMAAFKVAEHFDVHKWHNDLIKSKERAKEIMSPVQELSMLCQKKDLASPVYEAKEKKEVNMLFQATCSIGELKVESGWSHSKKAAKVEAAKLMLHTLKTWTPHGSPANGDVKPNVKRKSNESDCEITPEKKPVLELLD
ncbi:uncharacterized protein LOC128982854 [Macrosteles quadrilineatus]|uniref:uncharacterized protein LOC128982854 n=1 Tax=Macrosteles quadrilineatus TaxID=74068 RepID=UPI0023E166E6|nr:uncharacterized protein LOC128982854 [Macrosteles quadrilineatus]